MVALGLLAWGMPTGIEMVTSQTAVPTMKTPAAAAIALLLLALLAVPADAAAESTARAYARNLDEIELHLRFGIELGPAELEQDIAFTEKRRRSGHRERFASDRRGLIRVEAGMGLLWLPAEPAGRQAGP